MTLTRDEESQLSAGNYSIRGVPHVIAHCAPDIVVTDLHTSTATCASLFEPDVSLSAGGSGTPHSCILGVVTVVSPDCVGGTVEEFHLSPTTLDIVQPDLTNTISEATGQSNSSC